MLELIRFLQRERALVHSRVLPLSVGAGLSRGLLILLVNAAVLAHYPAGMLALGAGAVLVAHLTCLHLNRIAAYQQIERLQYDLRTRLVRKLLHVDAAFFFGREPGELYNVLSSDIAGVATSSIRLLNSFQQMVLIAFCFLYLFWLAPVVGACAVSAITLGAGACIMWDRGGRVRLLEAHRHTSTFLNRVEDTLHGFKELRLNEARRAALEAHAGRLLSAIRDLAVAAERRFSLSNTTAQTFMFLLLGVTVFILPLANALDSSTAFQVLTVILFVYGPVDNLLGGYPSIARARVSLERLQALEAELGCRPVSEPRPQVPPAPPEFTTLALEHVVVGLGEPGAESAANEDERFVVGPIDLTIRRGEIVFIHGGNGSGKTTLLSALCGLRPTEAGRVLIDGKPVEPGDASTYRAMFSAVFADFHLFRYLYGLSGAPTERLAAAMAELDLPKRIAIEDGQFSSLALSAGQRRRVALSVALAEDRPVLLFDEFAADQDPAHRAFFYERLLPELRARGRTVIAITHDENRFHLCDQLVKMDQGRIVAIERGGLVGLVAAE
jgi:putative ATP-binding cassette transporter